VVSLCFRITSKPVKIQPKDKYFPISHLAKFSFVLLIFTSVFFYSIHAQNTEIKFNLVEGDNGKPLGQINSITQDPNGYMWFSGQGKNCLYRYDGTRMIAFTHDSLNPNSLSGAFSMETVYADNKGLIWIGFGGGGMDQFNPETRIFKHFVNDSTDPASLSAGMVSVILRDHLDRLWVGTQNGLDRLDEKTGKFIHYRNEPGNPSSLSFNWVRSIYEDRNGVLWVGTGMEFTLFDNDMNQGGLNRMESNGTFTQFKHDPKNPNSLVNNKVRAICEDSKGNFWIGTAGDGLHIMDREKGTFTRYPFNPAHPERLSRPALKETGFGDPISFIREDAGGAIWIGTYISGVSRYDTGTKKITHFEASNGYPDRSCFQSYLSRDGVLWLTSTDQSAFLYRVAPTNKKLKNFISGETTGIIYEDKQGTLWSVGFLKGLIQYDQNKKPVRQFKSDDQDSISLIKVGINSIFQNQQDTLLLCTGNGIVLFNKVNFHGTWFKFKTSTDSIQKKFDGKFVSRMIEDNDRSKWIATSEGLFHLDANNVLIKQYLPVAGDSTTINSELLTSVLEGNKGDIWVGAFKGGYNGLTGDGGINCLDKNTGRFRHYLEGMGINNLFRDSGGIVWAGTEKGLYRYEKVTDRFTSFFGSQSALSGGNINNMIEDDTGNLWIVTESFIVKLNEDRTKSFIYGKRYGIRPTTLQYGGLCKTSKDEILVGYNEGFYSFYAKDMTETSKPLQLNMTGFYVNNLPVFSGEGNLLVNAIEKTSSVILAFNQNNFSFSFAAIDYRAPETNKYYTRLENYDSIWREAGGDKSAAYINVPPGKYIFQVRAINVDGVNAEKSIQVIINPPWWKTTWAYVLYGLLLIGTLFGIDRLQKQRTIRKERQKAQSKELAQAKEIEKAYTELKITQTQLIQSEKMASLGELTAGIAHEIQNPLNFVNNFSDVNKELLIEMKNELDKGNLESAKEVAGNIFENEDKINHHGRRADAIVKGMLMHSRVSTGQKEPTDINQLADEYLRLAFHGIRAREKSFNVTMKTDFDQDIHKVNIVPQDIGRVLLNLYNNAFYAVAEKEKKAENNFEPTVEVFTKRAGNKIEIKVKDNGNGIPQKTLDKIFQPFFTTKPSGQGTGLGLSLSYDIIKAHGGEIKVNTREGEFTEFVIQIPYL
jgi:signal transduction histidine kinase/ligand-binding sensor domain-containing protein